MSRAVTADHVLFDECIAAFRPHDHPIRIKEGASKSYLLLSFNLATELTFDNFQVHPSTQLSLPEAYSAFISQISNPPWIDVNNCHLFAQSLATIVSFVFGQPVKAPRDDYSSHCNLAAALPGLAIQFPVLVAGPGAHNTRFSSSRLSTLSQEIGGLVSVLRHLTDKAYVDTMRAIRLVHLAHLSKRDDFGLAYFLLISAIEAMAQNAISRDEVREVHPHEPHWTARAQTDVEFAELFRSYKECRGHNHYLRKRFTEFVFRFSPPQRWDNLLHPHYEMAEYVREVAQHDISWTTKKAWYETYPSDLMPADLRRIIETAYKHRSLFTHEGRSPPHQEPTAHTRYFQRLITFDGRNVREELLPNFELMAFIAKDSISAYAATMAAAAT